MGKLTKLESPPLSMPNSTMPDKDRKAAKKRKRKNEYPADKPRKVQKTEEPVMLAPEPASDFDRIFRNKSSPAAEPALGSPTRKRNKRQSNADKPKKMDANTPTKSGNVIASDLTPARAVVGNNTSELVATALNSVLKLELAFTKLMDKFATLSAQVEELKHDQHNLCVELASVATILFDIKKRL